MSSVRLLHLSDLHAGRDRSEQAGIVEAALTDVGRLHGETPIDAVIFSGDVAFSGKEDEYEEARSLLVDPLMSALDLGAERIVLVPGNHDVDKGSIEPFQEKGLRDTLTSNAAVGALLEDPGLTESASSRLAAWRDFARGYGSASEEICRLGCAHVLELGGVSVGVAALNTAWRAGSEEDKGLLIVGERQVREALDRIQGCDLRVTVMHHPLSWLAPFDADTARRLLEATSGLVLSGHEHVADPTAEMSVRGRTIYCRAGCLYQRADYFNGYSVIDVDLERREVVVSLRTWWPDRGQFDQATNVIEGGRVIFPLPAPAGTELVVRPSYNAVLHTFGRIAIDGSLFGDHIAQGETPQADRLLIAPRCWPIPYREVWAARQVSDADEDDGFEPVDLLAVLRGEKTIVIVGDPEAGVSSALLWLLVQDFVVNGDRVPLYMPFDQRFKASRFERRAREFISGMSEERQEALPPSNIALDDVVSGPALDPLAKYIAAHRSQHFVLGCHRGEVEAVEAALGSREVAYEVVHIGPFGRGQLRELVAAIGSSSKHDQEHILNLIFAQHLPRSPFLMTALAVVLKTNREAAIVNESGLLDSYVRLLLGSEEMAGEDALGMDPRRREHLLAWLASEMVRRGVTGIERLEAELSLGNYFRALGWGERFSPGRVFDDLVERRVLVVDEEGIAFRHAALRHLFAAKAMEESHDFGKMILAAPGAHAETVKHAAGLRRNDRQVLEAVSEEHRKLLEVMDGEVRIEMFDSIKDRPGWSDEAPDVRQLKRALERAPIEERNEEEIDRQYDEIYDRREYEADGEEEAPLKLRLLGPSVELLSKVLKSSELVDDVELKRRVLKDAIHSWCLASVVLAVEEDDSPELRDRLEEIVGEDEEALIDRLVELLVTLLMILGATGSLASAQLEGVLTDVLDDQEFMEPTAHGLFATMFYALMRFPEWPRRLGVEYERHREHPIAEQLLRHYAVTRYRSPGLSDSELKGLEDFLAEVYSRDSGGDKVGVYGRSVILADVREELKAGRVRALRGSGSDPDRLLEDQVPVE